MFPRPALALLGLLVAGCAAAPAPPTTAAEPGLVTHRSGAVTLFAPATLESARRDAWLGRIQAAVEVLGQTGLGPLDDTWDGRLVVELPATAAGYANLAGAGVQGAAAVTRCHQDGSRITVNPVVADADTDYLASLVLHEAVHVATGSSCDDSDPQWLEEGLAEWVASEHSGEALAANQAWVADYLDRHGMPSQLPPDADFSGDPDAVSAAYALARLAVAATVAELGQGGAMEFFEDAFAEPADPAAVAQITGWYRAELSRLSGSGRR